MSFTTSITTGSGLSVVAILATLTLADPASASEDFSETPKVQVTGHAEETHRLDRAKVELRIKVRHDDIEAVTTNLAELSAKLMTVLEQRGFRRSDLSTYGPKSEEVWKTVRNDPGNETVRTRLGVDGVWGVRITLDGIDRPEGRDRLTAFVMAAGLGGATLEKLEFSLSNIREVQTRLDRLAAKEAIEKARELILATGAQPGRLLKINDTGHPSVGGYADLRGVSPSAIKTIPILPGETTIEASTEVTVEILTR